MNLRSLLFIAVPAGALAGLIGWVSFAPQPQPLLVLHGYEYPTPDVADPDFEASVRQVVQHRAKQLSRQQIYLSADEHEYEAHAAEFGFSFDIEGAVEESMAALYAQVPDIKEEPTRWFTRRLNRVPVRASVNIESVLDEGVVANKLRAIAQVVDQEPVDAQLLISEHQILKSRSGRRLSIGATALRFKHAGLDSDLQIEASFDRTPPRITEDDLAPVDVTRVLASYETSFRGKAGPRAVNIRTAGRYLDGALILPGEELSFNQQVGRRIHGRGFVDAPVIINDELELDVGGGVCQVATTLHAAAVFGNLDVIRRRSHSRPSGYAPLGLDATVIDGKVDLKVRNNYDEPLLVHVSFPSQYTIRVELLGRDPDVKVEHAYSVTERQPFARRIWHRDDVPLGGFERKQKGSQGMDVVSVLRIRKKDGSTAQRSYFSKYYPVPEVFWVGEGANRAELPELPEGAAALVVDGEEVSSTATEQERPEQEVPSLEDADDSDS